MSELRRRTQEHAVHVHRRFVPVGRKGQQGGPAFAEDAGEFEMSGRGFEDPVTVILPNTKAEGLLRGGKREQCAAGRARCGLEPDLETAWAIAVTLERAGAPDGSMLCDFDAVPIGQP